MKDNTSDTLILAALVCFVGAVMVVLFTLSFDLGVIGLTSFVALFLMVGKMFGIFDRKKEVSK